MLQNPMGHVPRKGWPIATLSGVTIAARQTGDLPMTPQVRTQRRPHPDPIGLVLAEMSHHDQLIIIATAVCGYPDGALMRLLPRVSWREPHRVPRRLNPRRRIEKAYERLARAIVSAEFEIESDRVRVRSLVVRCAYSRSRYVQEICLRYGIDSDPRRRCAAPGCDNRLENPPIARGGRPRETCSNACRQRLWRRRKAGAAAASQSTGRGDARIMASSRDVTPRGSRRSSIDTH